MRQIDIAVSAAEARYRAGAYEEATSLLEPLAGQQPPSPAVLRVLGLCRLRLGAAAQAIDLLRRAHALAPDDPWAQLHYGVGLQSVGRHAEAAVLFRSCQAALMDDPAPWLNLSSSLLGMGDAQEAVRAADAACLRAPEMPQAYYMLGLALLAADQPGSAVTAFDQALRLAPRFAEAWLNLGVSHYRSGDIEAAKRAMRALLQANPGNEAAASNLGSFLRLTGEVEASEALLRDVVARGSGSPAARINLAADLLQQDRAAEALALLEDAPAIPPDMRAHWQLQRVLALIKLGRLACARIAVAGIGRLPPGLAPLLDWRLALLAAAEGKVDQARAHAVSMETSLQAAQASLLPEHGIMAHYDLAKFWMQCVEPDRAFPHWIAGHRLLARFQPFSRAAHAAFIDATIAGFDETRLRCGPVATNRDATPVFVVGMPRSGTTLIEQILSAHRDVFGAGERSALGCTFASLGERYETADAVGRIADLGSTALDAAASGYLHDLHALDPQAGRIVDKMPGNARYLGLVALMLPGARIIACDRDPRDIGLSIFTYRFYGDHAYAHDLADLGWYIAQHRRLMAHWHKALPNPIMTVRLADWVEDFDGTLRRVLAFLGLPYDPDCENFHASQRQVRTVSRTQVRERVNARGLGRWRSFEAHLRPLIAALQEGGALDSEVSAPGARASADQPAGA